MLFRSEKLIWQGNKVSGSGNLAFMNGFNSFLLSGNGCINLNQSGATSIDATNAFDIFYEAFTNTPANVAEGQDFICFTGRENFNYLLKNLVDLNMFNYNPAQIATMNEIMLPGTNMRVVKVNGLNGTTKIYTGREIGRAHV